MKAKKTPKKEPVLKTDLSFDELIEGAFNDKVLKKGNDGMKEIFVLTIMPEKPKRKPAKKKSTKKAAPKKKAAKKSKTKK